MFGLSAFVAVPVTFVAVPVIVMAAGIALKVIHEVALVRRRKKQRLNDIAWGIAVPVEYHINGQDVTATSREIALRVAKRAQKNGHVAVKETD